MSVETVGVAGTGTMGSGIGQLASLAGYTTYLHDPQPEALARGLERVRADLARGAERGRWSTADAEAAATRLRAAEQLEDLRSCGLVVEAAPERLDLKRELFARLERACGPNAILATNTSSLSVTAIAAGAERPERLCGMHFFNPPALMRLVEVVAGERTGEMALATVSSVAERMGRAPARCTDSPGFIVNRCNRPFTLESLRMLGEGIATAPQIDLIVRDDGGYPMGPFELIDLIGVDVNLSVARSFYAQRAEPRWEPHPIQERLVTEGRLGRKTGRGFYEYRADGERIAAPTEEPSPEIRSLVRDRLIAALVNEACFAAAEGVAAPASIDAAMKLGLNHPRGPFEWGREVGPERLVALLDDLARTLGDDAHGTAPLLRRWAAGEIAAPA